MLNWSGGGTRPSTQAIWRPSARSSRRTQSGTLPEAACCRERSRAETPSWRISASWERAAQGSFQADVQDIVGGEKHTVAIQQTHSESNGKTLDTGTVIAFVVRDGKIAEGREYSEDTAKWDDFWA